MKIFKTVLGVLAAASLLISLNANAQENANRDENGKVVRGAYETNKFFDNTFIGIGAGINGGVNLSNGGNVPGVQAFGGLAVQASVGKWWAPFIGGRINYLGLGNSVNGDPFAITDPKQHFITADLLWNLTTSFWGYKETRIWNVEPYLSGGLGIYPIAGPEWSYGGGILNEFYLGKRINLFLDIRGMVAKASWYGLQIPADQQKLGHYEFPVSATLGLIFKLGKTGFDRHDSITPVIIPVPFTEDQYNELKDRVDALEKENAELKDKIAALEDELAPVRNLVDGQTYLYENGQFTAVDVVPAGPITLYFDCGATTLSQREKAHFEYFADNAVNEDAKLNVNGYADKQTGSARRNQQLSEQRVKYVVDLLKKAGAKEENIESAAHGASIQLFEGAAKNRVVTIEVKK
ncbi:MAG: OmpA family protein [Bacteroidales bacterium]|nr:OmpA family protein [Bacteroidales bacterium]